jgi:hypothetical protein
MATKSSNPPFPNPPLEVGVPQYPTPNVPDFYSKNGHIILVDKVSAEKGNYNPQPLDGSVVYKGRDASKWPSDLYLVAERPEPTGQYVMRYWANDRSLSSQNPWNFNVSYSAENPDYPVYSRVYTISRSSYGTAGFPPFALLSSDPIYAGSTRVVKQQMAELGDDNPLRSRYVSVQVVYESIPGPLVQGEKIDSNGATQIITEQTVSPSTVPSADQVDGAGNYLVADEVSAVDSTKSTRKRVVLPALPPTLTHYEVSSDLAVIKNDVSEVIRQNLTSPVITGAILDIIDTPMAFPWVKRTVKSLPLDGSGNPILPPSRVEYNTITYTFPGIIYAWQVQAEKDPVTNITKNIKSQISLFNNRYPVSMLVAAQNVISYSVGQPDLTLLPFWSVTTQPWAKVFFNLPDNTIHPPAPVNLNLETITKNGISYSISGGQGSTPAVYSKGQQLLIGADVKRWMGNIFIKRLVYVQEPV